MKAQEVLEWTNHHIKFVDAYHKKIKGMSENKGVICVKYKSNKVEHYYTTVSFEDVDLAKLGSNPIVVLPNSKHNFDLLVKNWKNICKNPDLKLVFFNPNSTLLRKWVIKPHIHNKICDKESLKKGLKAMFGTVDIVD